MADRERPTRRRVLRATGSALLLGGIAGCVGDDRSAAADTPTGTTETAAPTTSPGTSGGSTGERALDLREANVVGIEYRAEGTRSKRFSVTLHHDDAGEAGYADWWQVERLDGTRLGRRDLRHPHEQQPFTRSATVEIPEGVTCIVVRGHDETHGYGGRALLADLATGATRPVNQGSDRQAFDEADCPRGSLPGR